jgi:DNA-binding NarL/FixJ family response regulator
VVIADSNAMTGRLLSDQFKRHSDIRVISCATDRASLLGSVRQIKSDVALISADLQDGPLSGVAAVREVHDADPNLRSILLFDRPEPQIVVDSLRAGARGVFSRCTYDFPTLRKCIRRVREGQIWLGNMELEYVLGALSDTRPRCLVSPDGLKLLSPREEGVMRLVAEGLGNREIAKALDLSEHTIKNYLFHIFDKLGISNRVELVLYAVTSPRKDTPAFSQQEKLRANTVSEPM